MSPDAKAATALHPRGNIIYDYPCGCRPWLSRSRLLRGGAGGCGLLSANSGQVHHLHREEAMLLCALPLDFVFSIDSRSVLCLLGQLAAPLQVVWVQAQFMKEIELAFLGVTGLDPADCVLSFQQGLLRQVQQRWIAKAMYVPKIFHLENEGSWPFW